MKGWRLLARYAFYVVTVFTLVASVRLSFADELGPPQVDAKTKQFWSFQPVRRPQLPNPQSGEHTAIDSFLLSSQQQAGLTPNPRAARRTLIRRATYDLTGLPPSPADVVAFENDPSVDAFPRLVERLLASPHYGEKWGRHWLDLVRFAETNSYERDSAKPNAWRYRDYVIDSFNSDKPYNEFILEQLAGDELPERSHERIIATGYYRLGVWDDEPADEQQAIYDDLDDILTTTCQTFLGLTINCARCHDHKLDPIPQVDYYRLLAYFAGVTRYGGPHRGRDLRYSQVVLADPSEVAANEAEVAAHREKMASAEQALRELEQDFQQRLPGGQRDDFDHEPYRMDLVKNNVPELFSADELKTYEQALRRKRRLLKPAPAELDTALAVTEDTENLRSTHLLLRGNPHAKSDEVQAGLPEVLGQAAPRIVAPRHGRSSGRRLALARWIANPNNPLTARVMVNRIWQYHFGHGLVRSPNDFGMQGESPTHPELLDWLAVEFIEKGWSVKYLHRLIMNSAAYQRSSLDNAKSLATDPENRLLWRYNMRRLTAEEIRDSILAVNGQLNREVGGPSVFPPIPKEVMAGQSRPGEGWGESTPEQASRRSVYIYVKRSLVSPLIAAFDGPDTDFTCPVRFTTTQPTQALSLINGAYLQRQAKALQEFVEREVGDDLKSRVALCLHRVMQREATPEETERGVDLVRGLVQEDGLDKDAAFHAFCVVALNLNEFIYLD